MKTMYVTDIQHRKLVELAESETKKKGRFVSLTDALDMTIDIGLAEIDKRKASVVDAGQMSIEDGDL